MGFFQDSLVKASYVASRLKLPTMYRRTCNICGYEGYFGPAEKGTRVDARCPRCRSVERYRLFKMWLDANRERMSGANVLHFAPEVSMIDLIKSVAGGYRSADIRPGRADIVLNIENMDLPDASIDCIVCSHVLEHIDDRKALAEFGRVLKPGGFALIMVPLVAGWAHTYENPNVKTVEERTLHYGKDHIRFYGADIRDRIRAAGLQLEEFTAEGEAVIRYSLTRGEKIFVATRPS
jgi:SAM-dependent methyltransferase